MKRQKLILEQTDKKILLLKKVDDWLCRQWAGYIQSDRL